MKYMWWIVIGLYLGIAPAVAGDAAVFPAPLPGWQAGEVKVSKREDNLLGMKIVHRKLERDYTDAQNRKLGMLIDTWDCMGATLISQLHQDAAYRKKVGNKMRPLKLKGYEALENYTRQGQRNIVTIKITDCGLVHVGGPNLPSGALDAYLRRLDFKRIGQLMKGR